MFKHSFFSETWNFRKSASGKKVSSYTRRLLSAFRLGSSNSSSRNEDFHPLEDQPNQLNDAAKTRNEITGKAQHVNTGDAEVLPGSFKKDIPLDTIRVTHAWDIDSFTRA